MDKRGAFSKRTDEPPVWEADRRLLPRHLRGGDNSGQLRQLRFAVRAAVEDRLTPVQREQLKLYYFENRTKTEIGESQGVGSSTVCKTLKAAEKAIREYVEIYLAVCERVRRDLMQDADEYGVARGEIRYDADSSEF